MAEKVSTLVLEVDLECEKCYKKIKEVLCKLQAKENISSISFDSKNSKVTISGPFDPSKLSRKLRCKACNVIRCIKVPEVKKPDEKKPDGKKPDEKKPDEKKPDDKKPDEKKPDEKKPDSKKPDENKTGGSKPKAEEEAKEATSASTTTVNLQFSQVCNICYPWPCSDPSHCGLRPQHWHCEGVPVPAPAPAPSGHHLHPTYAFPPKWSCAGPSYCGGCGSCRGGGGGGAHGWPGMLPPMYCPGASCRGCKGCRLVLENKFSYEEYPPSACAIM